LAAWVILFYLRGADSEVLKAYFHGYLFLGGLHYKKVVFLLGSTIGGASFLSLILLFIMAMRNGRRLKEIYSEFNFDTKYIVAQRGRDTWLIGFFFIILAMGVLGLFLYMHSPVDLKSDTISFDGGPTKSAVGPVYSFAKVILAMVASIACVIAGMIALYAALTYGRFKRLPIEVLDDSISFFETFSRLPILAIDRPVTVSLEDAEIDFEASGKGSLVIANDDIKVAVSPKLDFINGSFDELADYIEKYAVEDED
jgi:hypothetical protein